MAQLLLPAALYGPVHVALTLVLLILISTYMMPRYFHFPNSSAGATRPPAVGLLSEHVFSLPDRVLATAEDAAARNSEVLTRAALWHVAAAAVTWATTMFITAPYGRHAADTRVRVCVSAALSWALQECPTLLNVLYYVFVEYPAFANYTAAASGGTAQRAYASFVAEAFSHLSLPLLLFVMHYAHRSVIYPLALSPRANAVPIHVTWSATLYCLLNGRLQLLATLSMRDLAGGGAAHYFPRAHCLAAALVTRQPTLAVAALPALACFALGTGLFFAGMRENMRSDYYLITLKEQRERQRSAGDDAVGYVIPHGGLFERVSCPNFFGEIVEWCGYALVVLACSPGSTRAEECGSVSWWLLPRWAGEWTAPSAAPTLAAMSFPIYVVANLLPRGLAHHAWYGREFGEAYTSLRRRAVFPSIL